MSNTSIVNGNVGYLSLFGFIYVEILIKYDIKYSRLFNETSKRSRSKIYCYEEGICLNLKEKVKNLPLSPGVYLMKDSHGSIIYVGKSKHLKQRVQS